MGATGDSINYATAPDSTCPTLIVGSRGCEQAAISLGQVGMDEEASNSDSTLPEGIFAKTNHVEFVNFLRLLVPCMLASNSETVRTVRSPGTT